MKRFEVLVQARFATRKAVLDISYKKNYILLASQVAESRKTKGLRKFGNIAKI